jgi:hypothetical protein
VAGAFAGGEEPDVGRARNLGVRFGDRQGGEHMAGSVADCQRETAGHRSVLTP